MSANAVFNLFTGQVLSGYELCFTCSQLVLGKISLLFLLPLCLITRCEISFPRKQFFLFIYLYSMLFHIVLCQSDSITRVSNYVFPSPVMVWRDQDKFMFILMPDSLYGARLQGITVDVFIKPCTRLSNDEYNYRDSLQARAIEGIGHC